MPRRITPLVAGEHYHVYNRGNNRGKVFFHEENYLFFLRLMRKYLSSDTVAAYCLMPNHFHLLLTPHDDRLSHRMQLLSISYTKAVNKRLGRVGSLFQGSFRAIRVSRDDYLLHLTRYLHLNPLRAGLVQKPEDWRFSSYRDYVGLRHGSLLDPQIVLAQFESRLAYQEFVASYSPQDRVRISHLLPDDD